jgi:DNA-binding PadR family transcriptional regulator
VVYTSVIPIGVGVVGGKTDTWQGTLALMVLKTLEVMGSQHGYGLARRIEQASGDAFSIN